MTDSVYVSRIDQWLVVTFAITSLIALAICVPQLLDGTIGEWVIMVSALLLAIGLPGWILVTTTYTLTSGYLLIRSGPFHWNVPLRQITAIKPTRSPLSSPALSLDRFQITYSGGKVVMISPEERTKFLADLRARGVQAA